MNQLWQKFADFLHTANLIPLVVVVSTYHYYQALRHHDPLLVALPIALFIDLLHFRTVQRAVQTGQVAWRLAALFTTLLAFGLQWIFYSQPVDGETLAMWQVILFASIIPVGLAIMAWHHQHQEEQQMIALREEAVRLQAQAIQLQTEAAAEQSRANRLQIQATEQLTQLNELQTMVTSAQFTATELQTRMGQVQQEATTLQQQTTIAQQEIELTRQQKDALQKTLSVLQNEHTEMQQELTKSENLARLLQTQLDELQPIVQAWQHLNYDLQTLALFNANLLPIQAAVEKLGVHETTVRRRASKLNSTGRKP